MKNAQAESFWKTLLLTGLEDDSWQWDWTTLGTMGPKAGKSIRAKVVAKSEGIWAASGLLPAVESLSAEFGMPIETKVLAKDGDRLKKGKSVVEWKGPARAILAFERPFLNLASYSGGIATATNKLVVSVEKAWKAAGYRGQPPRVTSTRKILPHFRDLAIHAVFAGGGYAHRLNLAGGVLIKENHIAAAGGIGKAIAGARAVAPHGFKVEIEVRDLAELKQALAAGAEVVMLDNFSPEEARKATDVIRATAASTLVEISGGLDEANIGGYAFEGVHILSSGSLTHSVKAHDLSMLVEGT